MAMAEFFTGLQKRVTQTAAEAQKKYEAQLRAQYKAQQQRAPKPQSRIEQVRDFMNKPRDPVGATKRGAVNTWNAVLDQDWVAPPTEVSDQQLRTAAGLYDYYNNVRPAPAQYGLQRPKTDTYARLREAQDVAYEKSLADYGNHEPWRLREKAPAAWQAAKDYDKSVKERTADRGRYNPLNYLRDEDLSITQKLSRVYGMAQGGNAAAEDAANLILPDTAGWHRVLKGEGDGSDKFGVGADLFALGTLGLGRVVGAGGKSISATNQAMSAATKAPKPIKAAPPKKSPMSRLDKVKQKDYVPVGTTRDASTGKLKWADFDDTTSSLNRSPRTTKDPQTGVKLTDETVEASSKGTASAAEETAKQTAKKPRKLLRPRNLVLAGGAVAGLTGLGAFKWWLDNRNGGDGEGGPDLFGDPPRDGPPWLIGGGGYGSGGYSPNYQGHGAHGQQYGSVYRGNYIVK